MRFCIFIAVFVWKLRRFQELKVIRALTVKSDVRTTFCPNFDFTVKALMISNSLYHHHNFQMNTDMNLKIGSYNKLCTQNKILASKMQNLKEQKTSIFAPLILKRWISKSYGTKVNNIGVRDRRARGLRTGGL